MPDLKSSLSSWWKQRSNQSEDFFALHDINLVINKGDVVGLIGPNGAGKSTLLKLLSRITFPTKGRITIYGNLSSMLEVGTGFHPELSGRANIYLNGAIIGMRREEVNRKLDSIVAFSGIESFIDTPVKHYSSGMYVRLAFSVASHLEPDILLVDEVLTLGDQEFKNKCMEKLLDVSSQGRTIIMVSHQMSYLKELCHTGLYLNSGKLLHYGPIDETINRYINQYHNTKRLSVRQRTDRRGAGIVRLNNFEILDKGGNYLHTIPAGEFVNFRLEVESPKVDAFNVVVQIEIFDRHGQIFFVTNNAISNNSIPRIRGRQIWDCIIPKIPLNAGWYSANVGIYVSNRLSDDVINVETFEVVPGLFYTTGKLPNSNKGLLVDYTWKENVH